MWKQPPDNLPVAPAVEDLGVALAPPDRDASQQSVHAKNRPALYPTAVSALEFDETEIAELRALLVRYDAVAGTMSDAEIEALGRNIVGLVLAVLAPKAGSNNL